VLVAMAVAIAIGVVAGLRRFGSRAKQAETVVTGQATA